MSTEIQKEPVRALVASLTGIPVSRVYWKGEPEGSVGPVNGKAGKITITVTACVPSSRIEVRRKYDGTASPPTQISTWGAHETLTLTFRAENFLCSGAAYDTLRRLRFRMQLPTSRKALRAADMAIIDSPSLSDLDRTIDTRVYSAASMDMRFDAVIWEVPPTDANEGWVEKVSSSQPSDPAAAPVYDLHFTRVE